MDLVSVQLYEGYSRACHAVTREGADVADYAVSLAARLTAGFDVDGLGRVSLPREKLALGFANGWADGEKFVRVEPEAAAAAAVAADLRGVMFWVIDEEGEPYAFSKRYSEEVRRLEEGEL